MIWLLIVPLIILYFWMQSHIVDATGHAPRSRSSLRSQRRKASRMGVDAQDVPYSPRLTPMQNDEQETEGYPRWKVVLWALTAAIWAILLEPWKWFD